MNIFITGASGYIGGSVAVQLIAAGHRVRGLVRSVDSAAAVARLGIEPVVGTLDDLALLQREAAAADAVINTASADHAASVQAFVDALADSGKALIHTSGSSLVGDDARGERSSEAVFDESTPLVVEPFKQPRRDIDLAVLGAAARGVRSAVICPGLIYGVGRGLHPDSVQIPLLVRHALAHGAVQLVGRGLNRWSNVHIDDVAALYQRVLEQAPPGALYFAEAGEASFGEIGAAIAARLGLGPVQHLSAEAALRLWGERTAFYSLGSNSRVRALRARRELGWAPRHASVVDWIATDMPVDAGH